MKWMFWDGWPLLYLDTFYVYDLIELVNKQLGKFFPLFIGHLFFYMKFSVYRPSDQEKKLSTATVTYSDWQRDTSKYGTIGNLPIPKNEMSLFSHYMCINCFKNHFWYIIFEIQEKYSNYQLRHLIYLIYVAVLEYRNSFVLVILNSVCNMTPYNAVNMDYFHLFVIHPNSCEFMVKTIVVMYNSS